MKAACTVISLQRELPVILRPAEGIGDVLVARTLDLWPWKAMRRGTLLIRNAIDEVTRHHVMGAGRELARGDCA